MKKFLAILVALVVAVCAVWADEAILFDYTVKDLKLVTTGLKMQKL